MIVDPPEYHALPNQKVNRTVAHIRAAQWNIETVLVTSQPTFFHMSFVSTLFDDDLPEIFCPV